jgi:hypothetical protein
MSAETQTDLIAEATELLEELNLFATGNRALADIDDADRIWLSKLGDLIGAGPMEQFVASESGEHLNLLDPDALKKSVHAKALLEKLYFSLRAMIAARKAGPEPIAAEDGAKVVIHNRAIAERLQSQYDLQSFNALFELCQTNGVFALKVNEHNGLVTTAEADENWAMSGRQWVTDTVRCGDIERSNNAHAWTLALLTLCDFYSQDEEMDAIQKSIADPDYYRLGGLLNGVAHIFIPHTLKRDTSWFNNKRLESHGLALKAICDTVLAGVGQKKDWGFSEGQLKEHGAKIAQTIVCLASYLKSINTDKNGRFDFAAPSAGPWEEIPFPEGLTWDTEAMRSGFESLRDLLFNIDYDESVTLGQLRRQIVSHQFGQWLDSQIIIDQLIKQARGMIIDRLFGQPLPVESPHRPIDCSLAFISTSTILFSDDVVSDVLLHYQLLEVLEEKLVRAHGIIRYAPFELSMEDGRIEPVFDSYLADNYWLMPELRLLINGLSQETQSGAHRDFGSSDCSSHDDYLARVKLARAGTEAQWCFVSVIAEAYCRQVQKLQALRIAERNQHNGADDAEVTRLIAFGMDKAAEYLNRSFARITPADGFKANGRDCPAWAIPEAYEMVSPIGLLSRTHSGAVAGANTPLAWGQASLFSAAGLFRQILGQGGCPSFETEAGTEAKTA